MTTCYPSLDEVRELSKHGNLIPVYREINADLETPVSAYLKIAQGPYAFLLESVEGGEQLARYSFIGAGPYRVVTTGPGRPHGEVDPLRIVEEELGRHTLVSIPGLPRFHGGAVGYLAYDAVRYYEPVPPPASDPLGLPESVFMFVDTLLVFDHVRHKIKVVSHVRLDGGSVESAYAEAVERIEQLAAMLDKPLTVERRARLDADAGDAPSYESNMTRERYEAMVDRIKEYVYAGDIIQAVPSQRLARPTQAAPLDVYRALRTLNPSPYMVLPIAGGLLHRWRIAGAAGASRGRAGLQLPACRYATPRRISRAGRGTGVGAVRRREGTRRAHHAGGPGAQRRRARVAAGHGRGDRPHEGGALLARDAPRIGGARRAARRPHHLRRAAFLPARRDALGRAQDPRHGDNLGAGGRAARPLRRSGWLLQLQRQYGHGQSPYARW